MKFKLTGNVSQFGLFHGLARTRGRLVISVVVATSVTLALGYLGATYIMDQSTSVGLNILLIALMMLGVMATAYLQGVLVGDLFFPGAWREQVILGKRAESQGALVLKDHNAEFFIVIFLLLLGNAFAIDKLAGDFFETYHNESFFRARLRAPEPSERVAALRDVADPTQSDLWENKNLHQIILTALDDKDASVREQAAWSLGVVGAKAAVPKLVQHLKDSSQPEPVRVESAIALARLAPQEEEIRLGVEKELALKEMPPTLRVGLLKALGLMGQKESFAALVPWSSSDQPKEVMIHALWAIQKTQSPQARVVVREALGKGPDKVRECALLDALKMVSSEEDVNWARKQFLIAPKETRCERVLWEERDERRRTIMFPDTLRTKYMKIVANSGEGAKYSPWFRSIASDPSEPFGLREAAGNILKQYK